MCRQHSLDENFVCALHVCLCVLVSRPICMHTRTQLRGKVVIVHLTLRISSNFLSWQLPVAGCYIL